MNIEKLVLEPDIFVLEGPAGSGKSTLIKSITGWAPISRLSISSNRRKYEGASGIEFSQLKDYAANLDICNHVLKGPFKTFVIDRWTMSQIVYGALRRKQVGLTYDEIYRALALAMLNFSNQFRETLVRYGLDPVCYDFEPTVHFIVLLPSLPLLLFNRRNTSQEYPYDAASELSYYQQLVAYNYEKPDCKIRAFAFDSIPDYAKIQEMVQLEVFAKRFNVTQLSLKLF